MKIETLARVSILAIALLSSIGTSLSSLYAQANNPIYILAVDWNSDGSQIAAVGLQGGTDNGYIFVLDTVTGEILYRLDTPSGGFASVDWSPGSRLIAVGGYDQTVKVIDVQSREIVATLVGHRWVVDSVDWNLDGTRLVSSSSGDQRVILWDATTYELIRRIEISDVWTVAFSPDDQHIAVGGGPGLWLFPADLDVPEGPARGQYQQAIGYLGALAWSHNGTQIAFGTQTFRNPVTGETYDPQVSILDSSNGTVLSNFEVPQGRKIFGLTWSPSDDLIATYSLDGSVRVWEAVTGTLLDSFPGNADYVERGLGFSTYGGRLAYGGTIPSNLVSVTAQTDSIDAVQALANSGIQIVVPAPSLERLQAIADACNAPAAVEQSLTASIQADQLAEFVAEVEALPENTIPPACAADLIAVAEALQNQ